MALDQDACYEALKSKDGRFDGQFLRWRVIDRYILSSDLPCEASETTELHVLRVASSSRGGRLSPMLAVPS